MIQIVIVGVIAEPLEYPGGSSTEAVEKKLLRGFGRGVLKRKLHDGKFVGVLSETLEAGEYEYHVTTKGVSSTGGNLQLLSAIEPHMLSFGALWNAIMVEDSLVEDGQQWSLSSTVFWAESTKLLVIREWWVTYRNLILSDFPHCAKLTGKSGRGKSVFLRYLIFYILLEAKKLANNVQSLTAEHTTDPRIAFMDRDNVLYHVTKENITPFGNRLELIAAVGKPHFYFSDNVDVDDAGAGLLVTMALSSGDADVLKNFSKRMDEARTKTRSDLVMPGLELREMLQAFPDLSAEEVTFKFDVVGGNPRLAFARHSADKMSSHYPLVCQVVEMMFPAEELRHKLWAINVVCSALDKAEKNKASDALDSSTFRDFVVMDIEEGVAEVGEVFASTFMGFVASRIQSIGEETTKATLLKLFGSAGTGVFFEYEAQLAFLEAGPLDVYHCICQRTGETVKLHLGGGNLKLIRNIEDLRSLRDGDSGMPTVSNFAIIDRALYRKKKFGLQMTNGLKHVGGVTKLPDMLRALGIQKEKDFSIVFVVPVEHLAHFVFPTNLGAVSLYLTTSRPCIEDVMDREFKKRRVA